MDVKSFRRFNGIAKEKLLCQNIRLDFNSEITEKALGLLWNVKNDKLTFQHLPKAKRPTQYQTRLSQFSFTHF